MGKKMNFVESRKGKTVLAEKEEVDVPPDFQPKAKQTSPYLTTPVYLLIGPHKARYIVPQAFLSESPQWSRSQTPDLDFWDYRTGIALPRVNEEVGHTLVHYLYTGTFQKLQSPEEDNMTTELKNNVHLYGIATMYGLAGLKELVLEEIQNLEGLGDIFDILETIKEASKSLLEGDLGLKPYIKRELKAAFESDDTMFEKERFLELFGEAKQFDKILMRIVTEIYGEKIAHISQNTPVIINGSLVEAIFTTELSSPRSRNEILCGEPAIEEPAGCEKLDEKPAEYEHPVTYGDLVDELHPLEKFPCQKQVPIPEKESSEKSAEPTPECSPWDPPPHHDQAVSGEHPPAYQQGTSEDAILPNVSEKREEPASIGWGFSGGSAPPKDPVPLDKPVVCEEAASAASAGEKRKPKKKEKKARKTKANHYPEMEAAPFAETVPCAEAVACAETAPCTEVVPCAEEVPCTEVVPCAEEVPRAEVAPCAEPAPCTEAITLAISSKKKIKDKKAMKVETGGAKNKNSQKEKETSELLDPLPGPSTSCETVNKSPSPIVTDTKSSTEYGIDLQHADESGLCASRATHLLVDDEWKKCSKCRALIHHLSLELART